MNLPGLRWLRWWHVWLHGCRPLEATQGWPDSQMHATVWLGTSCGKDYYQTRPAWFKEAE